MFCSAGSSGPAKKARSTVTDRLTDAAVGPIGGGDYLALELWALELGGQRVHAVRFNSAGELTAKRFERDYPTPDGAGVIARARILFGGAA